MVKIRFIHTADIHLGSFLHISGKSLPPDIEKAIETATLEGFRRVCDTAITNNVDFVLISGDLYDREARSVGAQSFFVEECRRLEEANIHVLVIAGNHDPLREEQELFSVPNNVKVFRGNQPELYEVVDDLGDPIARIIGQSYQSRWERKKIHLDYRVPNRDIWNIGLLHTQLEPGKSNYIPCSMAELKEMSDIHYWALGHIHQPRILNDTYPYLVYPGIPQGRDFGEEGRGGCILVELDPYKGGKLSFIPTASVVYKRVDIFIDRDPEDMPDTLGDLEDRIYEYGDKLIQESMEEGDYPLDGYVVDWVIRGRSTIHQQIKKSEQESLEVLTKNLRSRFMGNSPFLWTDSITFRTQPTVDYDKLMGNSPVYKEMEKILHLCLEDEDMQDRLMKGLGEIWKGDGDHENHEDKDDFCFHMDESNLKELLYSAKKLILERLVEGRD